MQFTEQVLQLNVQYKGGGVNMLAVRQRLVCQQRAPAVVLPGRCSWVSLEYARLTSVLELGECCSEASVDREFELDERRLETSVVQAASVASYHTTRHLHPHSLRPLADQRD